MSPDYDVFVQIVQAGSLSAAARVMAISPAMVSKRLARLEARLGVRLIHRTTRRLALTAAGERFHIDIMAILAALRDAENRVSGVVNAPAGPLRVSAPTSFGRLHITPRIHAFLTDHPRINLELDLTDAYVDLHSSNFDLAVRIASDVPRSLDAHRLCDNRRILCASPDYLERHGIPKNVAALTRHQLLAAAGQLPWRLVNGHQKHLVLGESHVRTNSSEVVRELATTGVGIALRSLWDVNDELNDGRLVSVLSAWQAPSELAIYAIHARSPIVPLAVRAFVDFLQRSFATPPWEQGKV